MTPDFLAPKPHSKKSNTIMVFVGLELYDCALNDCDANQPKSSLNGYY